MKKLTITITICIISIVFYTAIGTSGNVDEIKRLAPSAINEHGWEILRYEGYQYGSWDHHGGKVWYTVYEKSNPNIRYKTFITLWNGEPQFYYNEPEYLHRVEIK